MDTGRIIFRPLKDNDAGLLMIWLNSPHVKQWWTQDGSTPEDELEEAMGFIGSSEGAAFIIERNRQAIGYMQYYDPSYAYDGFYFAGQPKGALGIDMYIGDVSLTGEGLGPRALEQFADDLFKKGATRMLIDPDANNARAIKAFEKAGFVTFENHDSERWGRVTLMSKSPQLSS